MAPPDGCVVCTELADVSRLPIQIARDSSQTLQEAALIMFSRGNKVYMTWMDPAAEETKSAFRKRLRIDCKFPNIDA